MKRYTSLAARGEFLHPKHAASEQHTWPAVVARQQPHEAAADAPIVRHEGIRKATHDIPG
jgi:hypothetical protein